MESTVYIKLEPGFPTGSLRIFSLILAYACAFALMGEAATVVFRRCLFPNLRYRSPTSPSLSPVSSPSVVSPPLLSHSCRLRHRVFPGTRALAYAQAMLALVNSYCVCQISATEGRVGIGVMMDGLEWVVKVRGDARR